MNDAELDELLSASIAPLPVLASHEAASLAMASMPLRLRRGRMPRPRWLVPVIVAGSLALTGAASITAYQLSVWPWVAIPTGHVRTIPIPVDFTTDDGHVESCRAYVELRNAGDGDLTALNDSIGDHDWTGFGQQLYDTGAPVMEDPDGESRVGDELLPALIAFTKAAIPGVLGLGEDGEGVAIDALGMSCRPDNP